MPAANRGNELLLSTLKKRYPYIVNEETMPYIRTWLSAKSEADRARILSSYTSDNLHLCESILAAYVNKGNFKYPVELGKKSSDTVDSSNEEMYLSKDLKLTLALYLADKYLINFESSHCQPLATEYFRIPWCENDLITKYKY